MKTQKNLTQFFLFLIILFLISLSPAFACPRCAIHILIIPPFVALVMATVLTITAFLYRRYFVMTIILIILYYIILGMIARNFEYRILYHSEVQLQAMLPFLIALNLAYLFLDNEKKHFRRIVSGAAVCLVVLGLVLIMHMAGTGKFVFKGNDTACQSNLKNIGTALEMYSSDHQKSYPDTLTPLSPDYMKRLPRCIDDKVSEKTKNYVRKTYGKTIDDYQYAVSADHKRFTMVCSGNNHIRIYCVPGYPQYNSAQGLITGK